MLHYSALGTILCENQPNQRFMYGRADRESGNPQQSERRRRLIGRQKGAEGGQERGAWDSSGIGLQREFLDDGDHRVVIWLVRPVSPHQRHIHFVRRGDIVYINEGDPLYWQMSC